MEYEFETYRHVGVDYGDRKSANKGCFFNIVRFWRKYVLNRKQRKYVFCDTYSEWKKHVKIIIPAKISNYTDLISWLEREKRCAEVFLEAIKVIMFPVYIAYLQFIDNYYKAENGKFVFFVLIMFIMSVSVLKRAMIKKSFIRIL